MTSLTAEPTSPPAELSDPTFQAFTLLRSGFTLAPILFGVDEFTQVMVDWSTYLWSGTTTLLPWSADTVMLVVGVIGIVAGILVAVRPRIGGYVVAAWLGGIIVDLLLVGGYLDIALRDVGLLIAALALARLATAADGTGVSQSSAS